MDIRLPQENRIVLSGVSKQLGDRRVLDGIDLVVRVRELVVLLGPARSGKTMLLRTIAGLERASAGRVMIDGIDVTLLPARRRNISMAFQRPALFPHLRVDENIALALRGQRIAKNARIRRVDEVIEGFELQSGRRLKPRQLRRSERYRAGLARAFVRDPLAFLLDDPISALRGEERLRTRQRLSNVHHSLRGTTVLATRDAGDALALADRIAIMDEGRIVQVDTPDNLRANPANAFVAGLLSTTAAAPHH